MVFSNLAQKAFHGLTSSSSSTLLPAAPDGITLEMVLENQTEPPFSLQDFTRYLEYTYCIENLSFYEAVTDYKQRCAAYFNLDMEQQKPEAVLLSDGYTLFDFTVHSIHLLSPREKTWFETLREKFEEILREFILSDGLQEINLPYEVRHQLLQTYQSQQSYHPALLYPACNAVIELLRISAFIPFATDPCRDFSSSKKSVKSDDATTLTETSCFIKRITTSLKSRYTNPIPPSPPVSPPLSSKQQSSWKQINIPNLSSFKNPTSMDYPPPVTRPANLIHRSSMSTSSSSTTVTSNSSATQKTIHVSLKKTKPEETDLT